MLVITRGAGESLRIGEDVRVVIHRVDGNRVIFGVEAQPPTTPVTGTNTTTQTHRMRLVVTEDADFAGDPFVQSFPNNSTLFTNIVNWLAESESRITIPPRDTTTRTIDLNAAQGNIIFTTSVLLLPFLVLALGGVVWWRRR